MSGAGVGELTEVAPARSYLVQPVDTRGGDNDSAVSRAMVWQSALRECVMSTLRLYSKSAAVVYAGTAANVLRGLAMIRNFFSSGWHCGAYFLTEPQWCSLVSSGSGPAETRSTALPPVRDQP